MPASTAMRILLALAMLAVATHAAIKPPKEGVEREVMYSDLEPYVDEKFSHKFYYQVPEQPRGVVLLVHGCVSSGYNYWPQSDACDECRGMPEQMSHTMQALKRGYAVIAISSADRKTGCWAWETDAYDVTSILNWWIKDWGLDGLPFYGAGISSGASFLLKLPRMIKMDGISSEALGIDEAAWGLDEVKGDYPPTTYISMVRDEKTAPKIEDNRKTLKKRGTPVEVIKVEARQVYPTYFSERFPTSISDELSRKIAQGLFEIQMIDKEGTVLEDPRYTPRPWLSELQDVVPELTGKNNFPEDAGDVAVRGVNSLMNLAYASHEIISDYLTASIMWFETGGKGDMEKLLEGFTYGWPPTDQFKYTRNGTKVVETRHTLVTRPGTLPGCALEHVVQPGDFCFQISDGFGISLDTLRSINPTLNCDTIQPGNVVCLQQGNPQMAALETAEGAPISTAAMPAASPAVAPSLPSPPPKPSPPPPAPKPVPTPVPAPVPTTARASTTGEGGPTNTTTVQTSSSSSSGSSMGVIIGAVVGGVVAAALVAGGVWYGLKRRREKRATMPTFDEPAGIKDGGYGAHLPPIVPGAQEQLGPELTEVVEQTGSPSMSARRRRQTVFSSDSSSSSPQLSPTKRRSSRFVGGL